MKRTPLKRTPMKRRPRRGGRMPQEVYETTMFKRARGLCEAGLPGCEKNATDFHHRQRRQRGNDTVVNSAALCRACHHLITHVSPVVGRERGLIVHSHHPNPAEVPMCIRGRWVLLGEDGTTSQTEVRP